MKIVSTVTSIETVKEFKDRECITPAWIKETLMHLSDNQTIAVTREQVTSLRPYTTSRFYVTRVELSKALKGQVSSKTTTTN